jgi:hypothetical protein
MNSMTESPLTISYTGEPVGVNPEQITEEMFVPNVGRDGPLYADDRPGEVAARLFDLAESEGALVIPDDLCVDCYGDDDQDGGGFILAAYPSGDRRAGVTCGWRDVDNLARHSEDGREDNDAGVVEAALEFMVGEINASLKAE